MLTEFGFFIKSFYYVVVYILSFPIIMSSQKVKQIPKKLIKFLKQELGIPTSSIKLALRHHQQDWSQFPIILWQYGLITLEQLDSIFDWMYSPTSR